jgi:hypothetical protein
MSNMGDLLPLLVLAIVGVIAAALFDCVTTDDRAIRRLPKGLWVIVILLFPVPGVGAVMWFATGRNDGAAAAHAASGHPAGRGRIEAQAAAVVPESPRPRTLAPDDDPEFLADLAARTAKMRDAHLDSRPGGGTMAGGADRVGEEERLRRWEADLRQREERLRQRGEPPIEE